MLCVERGQWSIQSHGRLSNERIKNAKIVAQMVRSEAVEGASAIWLAGPMSSVRSQKTLQPVLLFAVPAALEKLHGYKPRYADYLCAK